MALSPEAAHRALTQGLVSGALGCGLTVERDEAESSVLGRSTHGCPGIPDLVDILIGSDDAGTTQLDARLWCRSTRRRVVVQALLLGGLVATAGSLLFGWLITWSVPAAMGAGLLTERLLWWRDRRCLRGRVHALVHNLKHFDQPQPQSHAQSVPST